MSVLKSIGQSLYISRQSKCVIYDQYSHKCKLWSLYRAVNNTVMKKEKCPIYWIIIELFVQDRAKTMTWPITLSDQINR